MKPSKEQLKSLPRLPGVYIFYDQEDRPIYVGKAVSLKARLSSYFHNKELDAKTLKMISTAVRFEFFLTPSELAALLLEEQLVKKYKPRYNVNLKDDKKYPYLKLTLNEEWPRLVLVRRKEADKAKYFGPYQGGTVREVLKQLKRLFPIRWCRQTPLKMRKQPCLYYAMGRCLAPCLKKVDRDFYLSLCEGIAAFLEGKTEKTLKKLKQKMGRAAAKLNFEEAKQLREIVRALEKVAAGQKKGAYFGSQEKAANWAGLEAVKEALRLPALPVRIEAFDISNLAGTHSVGSMVVFEKGTPLKDHYRRFKIKTVTGPDDVACLAEVVSRRYSGSLAGKLPLPDLVLIDGGKGQVNAAAAVLKNLGLEIPVFGLAKQKEELFAPHTEKALVLSRFSLALKLLQQLRDEAHRLAISYHQQRRRKGFLSS